MDHPEPKRKPSPRPVIWGSLTLFGALFVFLTFQLSASAAPSHARGAHDKKVATRKRASAESEASTDTEAGEEGESLYAEPEYAETEYSESVPGEEEIVEPEAEAEPEPEPEVEYVEPEVEEAPPVVTSSS
ncbi:MAG TPA: hypothetical protein VF731_04710 [Solirubrobacterales bacterium]